MPGMFMDMGLGVRAAPQARYGSDPAPATATQAAYGTQGAPAGGASSLSPMGVPGAAFWTGFAGFVFLLLLYRSLPG
jgi:hypothetical protein